MIQMENLDLDMNILFLGDRSVLFPLTKEKIKAKFTDREISFFEIEKLNISVDDVRRLISFLGKSSEEVKVCMLSSFYWSDEVQNALLKVLEETPKNSRIYLFGWSDNFFLPTVLSRVQKVSLQNTNKYKDLARKVLGLPKNERLESKEVKKILGQKVTDMNYEKNTESEKKDREAHILLLDALLKVVTENKENLKLEKDYLEKLVKISTQLGAEGGSPHLFIEWLLLSVPEIDLVV